MAISTALPISLSDVKTELGLIGTQSLLDCFANAKSVGFDATYGSISSNNLQAFRGYDHSTSYISASLAYNTSNSATACAAFPSTYYSDSSGLNSMTELYTDSAGTTVAATGYYSDGVNWRYWNSTTETFTSSGSC